MARILYIFPHPDDESFGPAPAMARQRREGAEVFLLTLTRGEATAERARLGVSLSEMGAIRYREMQNVAAVLDLSELNVMRLPDGGLAEMSPLTLEAFVRREIERLHPTVVVTYAIHGISGHTDHLACHAVVKRVFCEMTGSRKHRYLRRLAFFTLPAEPVAPDRPPHLKGSPKHAIDCVVPFEPGDLHRAEDALAAYVTYQEVVKKHQPLRQVEGGVCFELFREQFSPPIDDLFANLPD
jgi:N-acetylglucosamine malate deacetylase 2